VSVSVVAPPRQQATYIYLLAAVVLVIVKVSTNDVLAESSYILQVAVVPVRSTLKYNGPHRVTLPNPVYVS
jgi:hypothetical protein